MGRISFEAFSAALAAIHESAVDPGDWSGALGAAVQLFQASKGALFTLEFDRLAAVSALGHEPDAQRAYTEHYYAVDPTMAACLAQPPHAPATVYEQFSAAVRARGEYFAFARSIDIGDVIGVSTRLEAGHRCVLSLQRPVRGGHFDAEAKRVLGLLSPHVEIAHRVRRRLAHAASAQQALAAGLDRFAAPTFIVDASAAIRHMNLAAEQLLREARHIRGGPRLGLTDPRAGAAFEAALRGAAAAAGRSSWLAVAPGLEAVVAPLREAQAPAGAGRLALVVFAQCARHRPTVAGRMRQLYGLTPAEGRLVARLAEGCTLQELAQANRVSQATVRSQLRSVCAKTGVSRQADVVRLALGGPPLAEEPDA
jgi:DNA-binding CsgD family transcriptional regulator